MTATFGFMATVADEAAKISERMDSLTQTALRAKESITKMNEIIAQRYPSLSDEAFKNAEAATDINNFYAIKNEYFDRMETIYYEIDDDVALATAVDNATSQIADLAALAGVFEESSRYEKERLRDYLKSFCEEAVNIIHSDEWLNMREGANLRYLMILALDVEYNTLLGIKK